MNTIRPDFVLAMSVFQSRKDPTDVVTVCLSLSPNVNGGYFVSYADHDKYFYPSDHDRAVDHYHTRVRVLIANHYELIKEIPFDERL